MLGVQGAGEYCWSELRVDWTYGGSGGAAEAVGGGDDAAAG